jgi:hypothetical protein
MHRRSFNGIIRRPEGKLIVLDNEDSSKILTAELSSSVYTEKETAES